MKTNSLTLIALTVSLVINSSSAFSQRILMENIQYIPSAHLMEKSFFENFPVHAHGVLSRNLIWDMMAIENYAWTYFDFLQLNKSYIVPDIQGSFDMAEIGTYNHTKIEYAEIYSNTIQEMEIKGLDDKLLLSTMRMLKLERIN